MAPKLPENERNFGSFVTTWGSHRDLFFGHRSFIRKITQGGNKHYIASQYLSPPCVLFLLWVSQSCGNLQSLTLSEQKEEALAVCTTYGVIVLRIKNPSLTERPQLQTSIVKPQHSECVYFYYTSTVASFLVSEWASRSERCGLRFPVRLWVG